MNNRVKQFIHFNYASFNINNPPAKKYMLGLDPIDNKLYIYKNKVLYDISEGFYNKLLDGNKLKIDLIPNVFADKVWVTNLIKNKVSTVFKLKGIKNTYKDILLIKKPTIGDVYLVRENNSEYVFTTLHKWLLLGNINSIDILKLNLIYEKLTALSGYILLVLNNLSTYITLNLSTINLVLNLHLNKLNNLTTNYNILNEKFNILNENINTLSSTNLNFYNLILSLSSITAEIIKNTSGYTNFIETTLYNTILNNISNISSKLDLYIYDYPLSVYYIIDLRINIISSNINTTIVSATTEKISEYDEKLLLLKENIFLLSSKIYNEM